MLPCINGMTSYSLGTTNTRSLIRLASSAVISTASKHLHNDLAKAIKALEQKKALVRSFGVFVDWLCIVGFVALLRGK